MSALLEKIQETRNTVLAKMDAVKLADDLDNLDSVAVERAQLREKLEALDAAESNELKRIEGETQDREQKARAKYFAALSKKVKDASKRHSELTDKANELINELVGVLIEREHVVSRSELVVGGANDMIDFEQIKELREAHSGAHDLIRMDDRQFRAAWWNVAHSHGERGDPISNAVAVIGSDTCQPLRAVDLSELQEALKDIANR
ncbi:MAG: hypothetical protein VYA55_13000 [Pseudomonadota bacterium]|nr:hypothetical protein [Pseudomonadota bacterium]